MANDRPAMPTNYIIARYAKAGSLELGDLDREPMPLLNERPPS